jgi:hypothetical protein
MELSEKIALMMRERGEAVAVIRGCNLSMTLQNHAITGITRYYMIQIAMSTPCEVLVDLEIDDTLPADEIGEAVYTVWRCDMVRYAIAALR